MRGHIVKRYTDSYTIVFELGIDPTTGKRKQQWVSVKGTKKDAEKRLAELLHQLDTGTYLKPGKTNLAEFLERWLKDYVWPNLAPRTAEGYQSIVSRHLIPTLGNIALTQLKPEHLQRYYSEKLSGGRYDGKGGLNPRTVRHHHMALHRALQVALKWGLITRNPADAIDPPRCQRTEMRTLDEDGVQTFLDAARQTPYYAIFHLALFTGISRSELLALRWSDVDLTLCQISVNRALHHLRNGSIVFRPPKTAKRRRMVALPPSSARVLREHQVKQEALRLMMDLTLHDGELVFSHPDGRPMLPDTVSHAWTKLAKKLGTGDVRLHDARHSHASLMLKQGVHPKIVQERLGHASIQTTLDIYSHVAPGLQEAAAARFDEIFARKHETEAVANLG
ncbi:tyrosine-type recombinase/integrase [Chloroflexota bacterium]